MKKITILLISCLINFCISAQQNEILVLQENFLDNNNGWDIYSDKDGSVSMTDGKLIIENTTKTTLANWINVYLDTLHDFSITAFASLITSHQLDGYGLFFGAKDVNNGYYFFIGTSEKGGAWRVIKYEDGKAIPFTQWAASSAIKPGKNINNALSVKQQNGNWVFYINDQQVGTIKAQYFFGNKVGFDVDNMQKVAFSYLTVTNNYDRVSKSGKLCEILPVIAEQSKTNFYQINTGKIADEPHVRRPREVKANGEIKYEPSVTITDAEFNYIGLSDDSYKYISRTGSFGKAEDAVKNADSLSKQLGVCLKNFTIKKLAGKPGGLPFYSMTEKINGGYISGENFIYIVKDSSLRLPRFFVNLVISTVQGEKYYFIPNKSDNSKLALQLKQLRGYSKNHFKNITGEAIPGNNDVSADMKQFATSFKLENTKRSYIHNGFSDGHSYIGIAGENMTEKDATVLFNNMFEKLKKAIGSEMVYKIQDWSVNGTTFKKVSFIGKEENNFSGVIVLTISEPSGSYMVDVGVE